jgi:hypothetical protein
MIKIISCWMIQRLGLLEYQICSRTIACQERRNERTFGNSRVNLGLACSRKPEISAVLCRPISSSDEYPEGQGRSTIPMFTTFFWRYLCNRDNNLKGMLNSHMRFNMIPVNLLYIQGQRLSSTLILEEGS